MTTVETITMAIITGLTIYPVKSCGGIDITDVNLAETGLEFDRQWVVVNDRQEFLTQRALPRMALIKPQLLGNELVLTAPGQSTLRLPIDNGDNRVTVRVWNDTCDGFDAGDEAAAWFSEFLGRTARLVRFDPSFQRLSNKEYTGDLAARNAYSDGYPVLLISQASLDDLNIRLDAPLPMNRFRPNIVIDGIGPFEEDYITQLSRPGLCLKPVKPCTRCEITTTDQETGARNAEPLLTLSKYRVNDQLGGVTFGQNVVIAEGIGQRLRVGDKLTLEWNF